MSYPWRFASEANFQAHCVCIDKAVVMMNSGQFAEAVEQLDLALSLGESPNARWNRSLALLSVGRYQEGWQDFTSRLILFSQWQRADQLRRDLPQWHGERLTGKRLVIYHDAGYGDSVMLLRHVPVLQTRGIDVALAMPPELERLTSQLAPLVKQLSELDVGCGTYDLMPIMDAIPAAVCLKPDPALQAQWVKRLPNRRCIGIVWSSMRVHHHAHRNLELEQFLDLLDPGDCELVSLQTHDQDEARARGVVTPKLTDFADVAAVASLMYAVVSIDTAALHVAGAIGHPNVSAVLPYVQCWRWLNGNPFYPAIKLCGQDAPGDWKSAFSKVSI